MKFRPCIDLHNGCVKQIIGRTLKDNSDPDVNFTSDRSPAWFAKTYAKNNFSDGHIIKLGNGNDEAAKQALSAWPKGLQIGGDINIDNAEKWLTDGASKVIITSWLFTNNQIDPIKLNQLVQVIGKENIVIDLSCGKKDSDYYVVTNRWQTFTETKLNKNTLDELSTSCSEFLIHGIDVEGLQSGIDNDLVHIIKDSPITCVYAGGVRSINDLNLIREIGNNHIDVTIGSALDLFGGHLPYQDVIKFFC